MAAVRRAQQARAVEKKKLILEAAADLMYEGGLPAVTHRQVAAQAGVPVGSIGYYYNTREELLVTALSRLSEERHDNAQSLLAGINTDLEPLTAAGVLAEVFLGKKATHGLLLSWITTVMDCLREGDTLKAVLDVERGRVLQDLAAALAAVGFPDVEARFVVGAIGGATLQALYEGDNNCVPKVYEALANLLVSA